MLRKTDTRCVIEKKHMTSGKIKCCTKTVSGKRVLFKKLNLDEVKSAISSREEFATYSSLYIQYLE